MERPIEEYVRYADALAQDVVNTWGLFTRAGEGDSLSSEFKEVFETTCEYRDAKRVADNWRRAGVPTEAVDAMMEAKRQIFARAYKTFQERHEGDGPTVEGSLDIHWMNGQSPTATPQYHVFFLRYANFKSGAHQPNVIIGASALKSYLVEIGFVVENAKKWVEQIHATGKTVSIPNVMMPQAHLADYGL